MPRGKRQPVTVADHDFKTLEQATSFIRDMLNSLPQLEPLGEPHHSFLIDLLSMHPRAADKTKGEIGHFSIAPDSYGGRCFHLHRTDGSETDFSYRKCLSGEKRDDLVLGAMRTATMDQVQEFRKLQFDHGRTICCPFTGAVLSRESCHVDHAPPRTFYRLVQEWLAASALTFADVLISEGEDNKMYREMTDSSQRASWSLFHRSNATLRLTSVRGNLSDSKIEARLSAE